MSTLLCCPTNHPNYRSLVRLDSPIVAQRSKHILDLQDFNLRQTITQPLDLNWLLLWVTTAHSQNLTFSCSL